MTIHAEHRTRGEVSVALGQPGRRLTYRCDTALHRITASDEFGRVVFAFGGKGRGPGLLDTPLDIAFVRPEFTGECLPATGPDAVWLAVADYGNRRVQLFELDGAHVASLDLRDEPAGPPTSLQWREPLLEIEGVEGARQRVCLSAALLCGGLRVARPPREFVPARAWVN